MYLVFSIYPASYQFFNKTTTDEGIFLPGTFKFN